MPSLLTIPPIKYHKMFYGGRYTAVGYIIAKNLKKYKVRCETIIYNNKDEIFALLVNKPWKIELPGGTVEIDYNDYLNNPPVMDVLNSIANAEIYEEAGFTVSNLKYSYMYRYYTYDENNENAWANKLKTQGLDCIGDISLIYTADFVGKYTNIIEDIDKYPEMIRKGKFYPYIKIKKYLSKEHIKLIEIRQNKKINKLDIEDLHL